jgi:transposase
MKTINQSIVIGLRRDAHYWEAQHSRAIDRENTWKERIRDLEETVSSQRVQIAEQKREIESLKIRIAEQNKQIEALKAKIVFLQQQLFGKKSEETKKPPCEAPDKEQAAAGTSVAKRNRGKQPGAKGYGRKRRQGLPTEEIIYELPEESRHCPICGKNFEIFPGTDDSEEIDWEVRLVRRIHKRRRYRPICNCHAVPGIVTAEPALKLIPKGMFSIKFWMHLVLEKYLLQRPLYRIRQALALEGFMVSQGTLTGGLKRIGEVLLPLYTKILERNRAAEHWHIDETRWIVFVDVEGKKGHRWWLWVLVTSDTCAYLLDPSRSAAVIEDHLGDNIDGIINADRYGAYKALPGNVRIAFCWSHVRRDFLHIRDGYPALRTWAESWVNRINGLFRQNALRLKVRSDMDSFRLEDQRLRNMLFGMADIRDEELGSPTIHLAQKKALESLKRHWSGLVIFVDNPDIPMDNNEAERRLRNPVVGRKNYYGSGSLWSGMLTAVLFTILQTLLVNHIDPQQFLLYYFKACAQNGGRPPENLDSFLPWNLSQEQKSAWRYPRSP